MDEITEQNLKPEDIEIGGNAYVMLGIDGITKEKPFYAFLKGVELRRVTGKDGTDWGNQTVLLMQSEDGYEYKVTDWNFATKKKFKPSDWIGKKLKFSKWSEKRALLELAE